MQINTITGQQAYDEFVAWVAALPESDKRDIDYYNYRDCALARFAKSRFPEYKDCITAGDSYVSVFVNPEDVSERKFLYNFGGTDLGTALIRMHNVFSNNDLKAKFIKPHVEIQTGATAV